MMMNLLPSRKSTKYLINESVYKYLKENFKVVYVSLYDTEANMADEKKALNKLHNVKTSTRFVFHCM